MGKKHDRKTLRKWMKANGVSMKYSMEIDVRQFSDGSNINDAIKKLNRKIKNIGLQTELRSREYYLSKGQKKRNKRAAAIRRAQKELEKNQERY